MLKLNASYSKKVPAEGEYSSQSYHASVEVELPDGLTSEQLQGRIHETFDLVRNSVEAELHGKNACPGRNSNGQSGTKNSGQGSRSGDHKNDVPASSKQLQYLLDLARQRGVTPQQIAGQFQVGSIRDLTRKQCSELIESWRAA